MKYVAIEPLPPVSGQEANRIRSAEARRRAKAAWDEYQLTLATDHDALLSFQSENRERRLRPEVRVEQHINRGRFVNVEVRREYPYGPTVTPVGQPKATSLVKLKAALFALASAFGVAQSTKGDK